MNIARSLDKLHRDKLLDIRKGNMFLAYPHDIQEQPGFNPRNYELPALKDHIKSLAESYAAGRFVEPIVVQVVDNVIYVRDGHCRRRAMLMAIEEMGADLGQQPMVEFRGDENDADILVITSQSGRKLTALEVALMYSRMANRGKTVADIARAVGKTATHVNNMLNIHTLPVDIKNLIEQEVVSASLALQTYNDLGSKAIDVLKEGVEEVLKAGKARLTSKRLPKEGQKKPSVRIPTKTVSAMAQHISSLSSRLDTIETREDGSALLELTAEEVEQLRALRQSLEAIAQVEEEECQQEDATPGERGELKAEEDSRGSEEPMEQAHGQ